MSVAITLALTLLLAVVLYHGRMRAIDRNMDQIFSVQSAAIAESLWHYDNAGLASQAEGMLHYPYIEYVEIRDDAGQMVTAGTRRDHQTIDRKMDLLSPRRENRTKIGSLYLQVNVSEVVGDVLSEVFYEFVFLAVAVTIVAWFLLSLFQRQVIRHVSTAAEHFRTFSLTGASGPLRLDKPNRHDEIDTLVEAFNGMTENLRSSEKRFRDLLENIHLAALIVDDSGSVTFCNDYLLRLTGWTSEQTIGVDWFDRFVVPAERDDQRAAFERGIATAELTSHHESRLATADGKSRIIVWDNTLLHAPDGAVRGVASIGIDVTDQRSVEAQLRHAQKMEAIGHLAGGIAHDFNNILTVTLGTASFLLMQMPKDDPSRVLVEQIQQASEQATHITRSLLAFSRRLVMDPQVVNLNDIVTRVSSFLERIIGENIRFTVATSDEALNVHADAVQVEQVLINLVTNARDAMRTGGSLVISTSRVEPNAPGTPDPVPGIAGYARLSVSDTGEGMTEDTLQCVFEPFFTTKEVGKGTGLGLAIVYGIVEEHRGRIEVRSAVGEGTTFEILLPLVGEADPRERSPLEETGLARGSETILVVEDSLGIRRFLHTLLTDHGYSVLLAADGDEGDEIHARHADEIGLVLTDIVMPGKSGIELQHEIKKRTPRARVLFMSGYTADLVANRGELDPGTELMMKPIRPAELLQRIRSMLDQA